MPPGSSTTRPVTTSTDRTPDYATSTSRRLASDAVRLPVKIDNDANCAAWAEHRFGVGRGCRDFICVTLGTGIGGGFVFAGTPYRGAHGGAAEIGHMVVDPDGPLCGCGRHGCWEQFASGLALERIALEAIGQHDDSVLTDHFHAGRIRGQAITQAARDGDAFALELVDELAHWVGLGLGSLVNILEPQRIAIAGGIVRDWDLFAERAERRRCSSRWRRIRAGRTRSCWPPSSVQTPGSSAPRC